MSEFKINQFRYTWKGNWSTSTAYSRDDVVRYGANSYVCVVTHNSDADFYNDLNYVESGESAPTPRWVLMTQGGFAWRSQWDSGLKYNLGDVVSYGGNLYVCVDDHTSDSIFDNDLSNWEIYASAFSYNQEWEPNTRYGVNDVVRYGGKVYKCRLGHTSGSLSQGIEVGNNDGDNDSTLETWDELFDGVEYKGSWTTETLYKVNDLIFYRGSILRCVESHTSAEEEFEDQFWNVEFQGSEFNQEWNNETYYGIGSVVRYGGYLYYATRASYNKSPLDSIYSNIVVENFWTILSKGTRFRGVWSDDQEYRTGDVVRRGGNLYAALLDTISDPSTLDYIDDSNWELISVGQNWRGDWNVNQIYFVNDIVIFEGDTYKSTVGHESSTENFPGDNGNGFFYWVLVVDTPGKQGMRLAGDLLTFDLSRDITGDTSTFEPTGVRIGSSGQLLTIDQESSLFYSSIGTLERTYYVSVNGVDDTLDPLRGINQYLPWRTVKFACEQANDDYTGTTTVSVAVGMYEEVLPIIVPKRTVVLGSELRSTTIKPKLADEDLSLDYTFRSALLARISTLMPSLMSGGEIIPSSGNTVQRVRPTREVIIQTSFDPQQYDDNGDEIYIETVEVEEITSDIDTSAKIETLISAIITYIDFYLGNGSTDPELTGSNDADSDNNVANAVTILRANKEFLAAEVVAYMQVEYPNYSFDIESLKRDIRAYVDAWIYDITYTGNYRSLLAARYYRNTVLGSQVEDMFYCRDATGVRNCTLMGLVGALNPPGVFDLYQRPLGGAFVGLDPGWGPDDTSTWIINRSPYIQGVSTFGSGCVGQKIDGALHNGGNRSIVSNDFTQVLSDGIGAWVSNNGRAELVSVFSYYAAIGYLADNGGIIRSTNGNCSYGRYGAIADDIDATEIPKQVVVNNRNQQAFLASTFAGEFNDEIQLFEFANCGINYTEAFASIIGAGVGAQVKFEEFRDNAIFENRLLDTSTGIAQNVGGSGYSITQNNAQANTTAAADLISIVISSNDPNTGAEYLGKRIIIVGGTGTGQYGYITAYDDVTKLVSVSRESDDQPGWDHVVPGTPVKIPLDTSTVYRIEPRIIFSEPDYIASEVTVGANTKWSAIAYGETYKVFTGISSVFTEGDDSSLLATNATFDIIKIGRTYNVTLNEAGLGYNPGDILIINGTELGGSSPRNDITIVVASVTDDSSRSIVSYTQSGVASSGTFVALSSNGSAAVASSNGDDWPDTFLMPSAGDWTCLSAVSEYAESELLSNVRFVAIRNDSNAAASSEDGVNWTARTMPASRAWNAVAYGDGRFVAVAGDQNSAAISTDGINWTLTSFPAYGDSTLNEWVDITYGKNKFVAVANSGNNVAESPDGVTWEGHIMDVISDSSQQNWVGIAFGNNRFVTISSQGDVGYSFEGDVWYPAVMPSQDGSTAHNWKSIKYAQGVFFAVGDTGGLPIAGDPTTAPSKYAATSFDGIVWTPRELASEEAWEVIGFGNPYTEQEDSSTGRNTPMWIVAGNTDTFNKIRTGARSLGRPVVSAGIIGQIKIWDPGSGYINNPSVTIVDPNVSTEAKVEHRTGDGVLSNPSWINRGVGYRSISTRVTITGDGVADVIPFGKFVTVDGFENYPGPGAQIVFSGLDEIYTAVAITELGNISGPEGGLSTLLRVSPELKVRDQLEHGTVAIVRERYSQCRITGHDFLDIGTGNFQETNYPELYSGLIQSAPENEVYEEDGGRVFYTSTDQSGNFRCGELFAVEQATGIVTISADFFDFGGLSELRLGGIRVGGSGVVIREFSTDPTFTEDSNNVVPTQRAIARYLASRLSVGGSELSTASFVAGLVLVGPDKIDHTLGGTIVVPVQINFEGELANISGSIIAQTMFLRTEDEF
jgi:hypothetical protein